MLPGYVRHMTTNQDSLLCRFFGLYRLKPSRAYFVIEGNVIDTAEPVDEVSEYKHNHGFLLLDVAAPR
jgi:hypothetical protein